MSLCIIDSSIATPKVPSNHFLFWRKKSNLVLTNLGYKKIIKKLQTSQELRMLSIVTLDCQVIKIVMTSGSGQNCNQRASRDYSFLSFRFPIQELFATFAIPSDLKGLNFFLLTSAVKPGVAFTCLWHPERKKSCSTWKKCLHLMARSSQSQELLWVLNYEIGTELNWHISFMLINSAWSWAIEPESQKSKRCNMIMRQKSQNSKLSEPISSSQCLFTQHDTLPLSYVEALFKRGNGDL